MTTQDPSFSERRQEESPVDMRALDAIFGDNVEARLSVLRKFVVQTDEILASVVSANERKDADQIRFFSHKLKSSARTVGANHLSDICFELETSGRNADWTAIGPLIGSMQSEVAKVRDYIAGL